MKGDLPFCILLPPALHAELKAESARLRYSMSKLAQIALIRLLKQTKGKSDVQK